MTWGHVLLSSYEIAEKLGKESLDLVQHLKFYDSVGLASLAAGSAMQHRGDFEGAETCFKGALERAYSVGHAECTSYLNAALGRLFVEQGLFARAYPLLQEGLAIARKINHLETVCSTLATLSEVDYRHLDGTNAESYLLESLALASQMAHIPWCALYSEIKQGEFQIWRGDAAMAEQSFNKALSLAITLGAQESAAVAKFGLAKTGLLNGILNEAESYARGSLRICVEIGHWRHSEVTDWLVNTVPEGDL